MSETEDGTFMRRPSKLKNQVATNTRTASKQSDLPNKAAAARDPKSKNLFKDGNIRIVESQNDMETQDSNRF